jgi:glycosyltransferase involved in cell wall biosynthesis
VNGNFRDAAFLVTLRRLDPRLSFKVVLLDVVLRRPTSFAKLWIVRRVLRDVDYFIHYFKDLSGYGTFYSVTKERSGYVPFKPNLSRLETVKHCDGEYVLCFGRSMRDYDLFFQAISELDIPGAIPRPNHEALARHGSRLTLPIPKNVSLLDDDGSSLSLARILERAKVVALPILPENICASGIGTYLNAMLFRKPVIITAGPGTSDVLHDEALLVEPGNAEQLRATIFSMWHDKQLAAIVAQRGYEYARSLGGVQDLCDRVLTNVMDWYYGGTQSCENTEEAAVRSGADPRVPSSPLNHIVAVRKAWH